MSRTAGTSTSSWLLKQENKENRHARSHDNLSGVITEKPVGGLGIAPLAQAGHGAAPGRRWGLGHCDVLAVRRADHARKPGAGPLPGARHAFLRGIAQLL